MVEQVDLDDKREDKAANEIEIQKHSIKKYKKTSTKRTVDSRSETYHDCWGLRLAAHRGLSSH